MKRRGVYAIVHIPTGSAYIGGSVDMVSRFTWHRHSLRNQKHTSPLLQVLWDSTLEREWVFIVVEFTRSRELRNREQWWMDNWPGPKLNDRPAEGGFTQSAETRAKISIAAKRLGADPEERKRRSVRAREQHRRK